MLLHDARTDAQAGGVSSAGGASARAVLLEGFSRSSWWALLLLVTIAAAVGYRHSDLLDANGDMDWLLTGIWFWLAVLVCWGVRPWADAGLIVTGLAGGAVIETWGTHAGLWAYFTGERPPLWILPAWPIASLAIERLSRWLKLALTCFSAQAHVSGSYYRMGYWAASVGFLVAMFSFMRPAHDQPLTQAVMLVMLLVVITVSDPRADLLLFAAGTALGLFLEYWGTSRLCWTYYTAEVPPLVAVPAHGFAALAFSRVCDRLPVKFRRFSSR